MRCTIPNIHHASRTCYSEVIKAVPNAWLYAELIPLPGGWSVRILVPIMIGAKRYMDVSPFFEAFAEKNVRFYEFIS